MLPPPVLSIATAMNLVYDANGNLVTGDSFYRKYNELNQQSSSLPPALSNYLASNANKTNTQNY